MGAGALTCSFHLRAGTSLEPVHLTERLNRLLKKLLRLFFVGCPVASSAIIFAMTWVALGFSGDGPKSWTFMIFSKNRRDL